MPQVVIGMFATVCPKDCNVYANVINQIFEPGCAVASINSETVIITSQKRETPLGPNLSNSMPLIGLEIIQIIAAGAINNPVVMAEQPNTV